MAQELQFRRGRVATLQVLTPRFKSGMRDVMRETHLYYHNRITSRLSRGVCKLVIRRIYRPTSERVILQLVSNVEAMVSGYIEPKLKEATGRLPHDARLNGKIYGVLAIRASSAQAPFPITGNEERRSTTGS